MESYKPRRIRSGSRPFPGSCAIQAALFKQKGYLCMVRNRTPCKDCQRRVIGCSAHCEDYDAFKADYKARQDYLRIGESEKYTSEYIRRRKTNKRKK